MENQKDDSSDKKDLDKKGEIKTHIDQIMDGKKKPVAKDLVQLEHVEIKKQNIGQDTLDLAKTLKDQYIEHDQFEQLTNDELTILESFITERMFLTRIAIVANQSRVPLGIEPYKKADLERILESLISKDYVMVQLVGENKVYTLTERGKYRIQ